MPDEYDVAVIEGAATTQEHLELLKEVRDKAAVIIAVGACALTGGIPALANVGDYDSRYGQVYPDGGVKVARDAVPPRPITDVIEVDYRVPGCPIDQGEYLTVLSRALGGLADKTPEEPMCASCKTKENVCFFDKGQVCLGLVTRNGCGARCVSLGRPCTGCRGIAEDANLDSALKVFADIGVDEETAREAYRLYNAMGEAAKGA
jgi:coenzyme F420-reducing hydrogenase gamma subunit